MPITFACTKCDHKLRVPDNVAGKRVKCPKCKEVLRVPDGPEETGPATEDTWHVKIEDGDTYGPVSKSELDQWVDEGRVTAESQVLREGADQWQWASDLYPELEESRPEPPEPAPVNPTPAITVDTGKESPSPPAAPVIAVDTGKDRPSTPAAPVVAVDTGKESPRPSAAPVATADPGKDVPGPVAAPVGPSAAIAGAPGMEEPKTAQPPLRSRSYPAMDSAGKLYRILAWIVLALAAIGTVGYLVVLIRASMARSEMGMSVLSFLGTGLFFLAMGVVYATITVVTLRLAPDAIRCVLDIQNTTHRSNTYLQQLTEKRSKD